MAVVKMKYRCFNPRPTIIAIFPPLNLGFLSCGTKPPETFASLQYSLSIVLDELTAVDAHFPLSWTNFLREMFTSHCLEQISCGKCSLPVVLSKFPARNVHFPLSWANFLREMFTSHCLEQISCGKCSLPIF